MLAYGRTFDEYTYADLSGVNFYERFMSGELLKTGWVNATDFKDVHNSVED